MRLSSIAPLTCRSTMLGLLLLLNILSSVRAGSSRVSGQIEFNRDIRPIFSDKCYTCHGPDKANRVTELRFDTEAGSQGRLGKWEVRNRSGRPAQERVVPTHFF